MGRGEAGFSQVGPIYMRDSTEGSWTEALRQSHPNQGCRQDARELLKTQLLGPQFRLPDCLLRGGLDAWALVFSTSS